MAPFFLTRGSGGLSGSAVALIGVVGLAAAQQPPLSDSERPDVILSGALATDGACEPDAETLCLHGGRYELQADWWTGDGNRGAAQVVPKATRLFDVKLMCAQLDWADLRGAWMKDVSAQGAHLHGAKLQGAQVHVNKPPAEYDFTELIESFTDRDTNLDGVVFNGGLTEQDVDAGIDGLSPDAFPDLREHLADAVGPPPSHDLAAHSGAEIGRYSFEEARCWIRDYRAALLADPPLLDPGGDPRP